MCTRVSQFVVIKNQEHPNSKQWMINKLWLTQKMEFYATINKNEHYIALTMQQVLF